MEVWIMESRPVKRVLFSRKAVIDGQFESETDTACEKQETAIDHTDANGTGTTTLGRRSGVLKLPKTSGESKKDETLKKRGRRQNVQHKLQDDDSGVSWLAVTFLACLILLLCVSLVFPGSLNIQNHVMDKRAQNHSIDWMWTENRRVCVLSLLTSVGVALVLGLACCGFSSLVIYFDSMEPGHDPPTPLSPSKYRDKSGHTFHMSYIMSLVNGAVMFLYVIWWSRHKYLSTG